MCQLSKGFRNFIVLKWPVGQPDRRWKVLLNAEQGTLVYRSNGDRREAALPRDLVLVRRQNGGEAEIVFVGFADEGWLKIHGEKGEDRVVVLRDDKVVFNHSRANGWLTIETIRVSEREPVQRDEPCDLAQDVVAKMKGFLTRGQLAAMRWQELIQHAANEGVKATGRDRTRKALINDLMQIAVAA